MRWCKFCPNGTPILKSAVHSFWFSGTRFLHHLEDGRLPVSNNYCEANIKPFATARRAWLFADTPKGAFANGVLYTLVESARANELDVYEYLKYLLTETPNNHHLEDPSVIDSLLPWSKELPEQCHLKRNRKKCLKHWCRYYSRNSGFFFLSFHSISDFILLL